MMNGAMQVPGMGPVVSSMPGVEGYVDGGYVEPDYGSMTPCNGCGIPGCGGGCGLGMSGDGFLGGGSDLGPDGEGRPSIIWGGGEYLMWWHKPRGVPPLVTTSPIGTPDTAAGVVGQAGTQFLFGNDEVPNDQASGFRATAGVWLNRYQSFGFGSRYFELDGQGDSFSLASTGDPILARPFFNVDPGINAQDSLLVAYPGISEGSIEAVAETEIRGGDVFARCLLYAGYCNRLDLIGGYQFTEIEDLVQVSHNIVSVDGTTHGPVGTTIETVDRFLADNEFNGGSIGLMSEARDGRLTWSLFSKIAFGNMRQRLSIEGQSTTTVPGAGSATSDFGLLALPSNIGVLERDEFSIVPELTVAVAYNVTNLLQLSVGYNVIYWSDVVYASDAVDTTINPTQITGGLVGPNRPLFTFPDSRSFWTQGLSFGVHGRF
jgi:hypothetical protein